MVLFALVIAGAVIVALVGSALWGDRRLSRHARLPMQWGLDGLPTWQAPRRVALFTCTAFCALTPLIVAGILVHLSGQAAKDLNALLGILGGVSLISLLMQGLYLGLLLRWDRTV